MVAGINHQSWVLSLRHRGQDLYSKLWDVLETHESFVEDQVSGRDDAAVRLFRDQEYTAQRRVPALLSAHSGALRAVWRAAT